ncbi:adenosine deaminase-like protein [Musca vetustissima]|uniref:adenosine deaminase-like protein n=1 Tax=Musca vetustissima TaxID=27455 RepID=UPI002AB71B7E|nr:adenosine deaminase-like protein [Musca vetustissima]
MDSTFFEKLPKIELHAHLNGSLKMESIQELGMQLYGENSADFLGRIQEFTAFPEEMDADKLSKCFQKFAFMHELTSTKKGLQLATHLVIRDFARDNVVYLELRTTPKHNEHMTRKEYLETILNAIEEAKGRYPGILVKLLVSIDRSQVIEAATDIVNLTMYMKKNYPNIIKGMDLSGNPAKGNFNDFMHLLEKVKASDLKLALHCAEIENEKETQQMLDFNFERCGHGTYLSVPQQMEQCKRQQITVECCLTSNVKCGTVKHYEAHHFKTLRDNGIKTVICTDDCGVFDSTLSQEFAIAARVFSLDKNDICDLCINAIDAAFCDNTEKLDLRQQIDRFFAKNK